MNEELYAKVKEQAKYCRDVEVRKKLLKNCPDDSVEAEAQGSEEKVQEFIKACHQGPTRGQVKEVKIKRLPNLGAFEDFEIKF